MARRGGQKRAFVEIDGAAGEGGGQVLRSSLALSLITGAPVRIKNIRARRSKPGLLRQHLTAVRAATEIGDATVTGDELRSSALEFTPKEIRHGEYRFAVGTAGSSTLVFQTVLWPLALTPGRSRVVFEGGTHNPKAPPFEFIARAFLPLIERMGVRVRASIERHGFYPAGGGRFVVEFEGGVSWQPLHLRERGELKQVRAEALWANLPKGVADRELLALRDGLGLTRAALRSREVKSVGPGNAVLVEVESERCTEVFADFGARGRPAEEVAEAAMKEARAYLDADVPVAEHLADQLLLPMALAGAGSFRTVTPSLHTTTNIEVIGRFLDVDIRVTNETREDGPTRYLVRVGDDEL
ncbi:MAG: RNA 3'-terminal phosphate cyclase [Myxococcales bacterium]|nr:RNA 3'-terminal phosphate cyclase [Myxococcales bacterium]